MDAVLSGFAVSLSLILAIGAQNAFVLRQGLAGHHVGPVVFACAASDAVLILAGVAGFGALTETLPSVATLARWGGAAFLAAYGFLSFRRALGPGDSLQPANDVPPSLAATLSTCLALTWLNPHVYLDTVVLIGAVAAGFAGERWLFAFGAVAASAIFFTSLGYGARLLRPLFSSPRAWRLLDAGVGVVMWSIAVSLLAA